MEDGLLEDLESLWSIDFSDLEFNEKIGEGAFGAVFKGTYCGTEVAIKKMWENDEDTLLYIKREISVLKGVRHPNIVQFIGVATDIDQNEMRHFYIITEFVEGGDLRKRLNKKGVEITWKQRVKLAHDAATAMVYLHNRDIMHRDLKAKNFLVNDQWKVRLCDFGFARIQRESGARPMTLCGTEDWMAPEIICGEAYNKSVDVFSFGLVLCEIITRERIPKSLERTASEAFGLNIDKFVYLVPDDCPPDFAQIAIDCAAWTAEDRPTFKEIVQRLNVIVKSIDSAAAADAAAQQEKQKQLLAAARTGKVASVLRIPTSGPDFGNFGRPSPVQGLLGGEEKRRKEEADRKKQQEEMEELRKQWEAEALEEARIEAENKKQAEADKKKKADEEAQKKAAEDAKKEEERKKAEEEKKKVAAAENDKKSVEEDKKKKKEDEKKKKEEEKKKKEDEKKKAEEANNQLRTGTDMGNPTV
eukprot:TRINITY_DN4193_c0_g1_i3.p1 TRINITY_DN4193_c0_g1~~TRINITY_DN4193_c0_g1_i3.p1  ORF type:complete len:473 (-),score=188.30 TRINITY_DN4193_c0_g1_i3:89-1507(-)